MSYTAHDLFSEVIRDLIADLPDDNDIKYSKSELDHFLDKLKDLTDYKQQVKIVDLANMILDTVCENNYGKISAIVGDKQYFIMVYENNVRKIYGHLPVGTTLTIGGEE